MSTMEEMRRLKAVYKLDLQSSVNESEFSVDPWGGYESVNICGNYSTQVEAFIILIITQILSICKINAY